MAELPPVTAETFKQKVLTQRAADAKARERHSHYCEACRKAFASDKSYESHLRSKKHKEREASSQSEADDGIDDASEATTDEVIEKTLDNLKNLKIGPTNISVADDGSEAVVSALVESERAQPKPSRHTTEKTKTAHKGTTVALEPANKSEVVDKEEECVSDDSDEGPQPLEVDECLFCPHISQDMEHSLKHMSYAHGFFVPDLEYLVDLKGLVEHLCYKVGVERSCLYCQTLRVFYSVEAVQHHMVDKAHCKLYFEGNSALDYAEYYDYTKSYAKSGEIDVSEGELGDLPIPDNSLEVNEDMELVLPSGAKASHRAMKLYYKQRLPTLEQRTSTVVTRLVAQYRAIGWRGKGEGEAGKKSAMDESLRHRKQQRRELKLSTKANKQQPHFRPQVVF